LLAGRLVDVRAAQHRPAVDDGGQQDRAGHARARPAQGLHDLLLRPVEQLVVVGLQANPDLLIGGQGCHGLLRDLRDHARPHRPPPLPDREPQLLLHRDRHDQLDRHRHVVPRHHHLHPTGQRAHPRHVRRPKVKLRPVPVEVRRVPPPPLLPQHVHVPLDFLVGLDRARLSQHLPALHFVLVDPAQQRPNIVPRLPLVQELAEHLHPRHHRLARVVHPDDLDLLPHLHDPSLHPARHHRPPPRDREYVLDRHQKRLLPPPRRRRDVAVHRLPQIPKALPPPRVLRLFPPPPPTAPPHPNFLPPALGRLLPLPPPH